MNGICNVMAFFSRSRSAECSPLASTLSHTRTELRMDAEYTAPTRTHTSRRREPSTLSIPNKTVSCIITRLAVLVSSDKFFRNAPWTSESTRKWMGNDVKFLPRSHRVRRRSSRTSATHIFSFIFIPTHKTLNASSRFSSDDEFRANFLNCFTPYRLHTPPAMSTKICFFACASVCAMLLLPKTHTLIVLNVNDLRDRWPTRCHKAFSFSLVLFCVIFSFLFFFLLPPFCVRCVQAIVDRQSTESSSIHNT